MRSNSSQHPLHFNPPPFIISFEGELQVYPAENTANSAFPTSFEQFRVRGVSVFSIPAYIISSFPDVINNFPFRGPPY